MKIRTVTLGLNWPASWNVGKEKRIKEFFSTASEQLSLQGYELRTRRITFTPLKPLDNKKLVSEVAKVSDFCKNSSIRWFCVPFETKSQDMNIVNKSALGILKKHSNSFVNYIIANDKAADQTAMLYAGKLIRKIAALEGEGLDNFRFGASFNCKPHCPFFPFSYHKGKDGFSVALELVPLLVKIVNSNRDKKMSEIKNEIIKQSSPMLKQIEKRCLAIEKKTSMKYYGIDLSLAPHPEEKKHSVTYLIERLGVDRFGCSGTAFLTSFLTEVIKSAAIQSKIKTVGFNGVMYSVLEDPGLGHINSEEDRISIDDLMLFSTMCGCGIDMVPLPGTVSEREIASVMLDVSALAMKLKKPLGVRLLPIPNKVCGEMTKFEHDFLHNTKVLQIRNRGYAKKLFNRNQIFSY